MQVLFCPILLYFIWILVEKIKRNWNFIRDSNSNKIMWVFKKIFATNKIVTRSMEMGLTSRFKLCLTRHFN